MREHQPRRARNARRSNKCTSCSFFNNAPYSGGITSCFSLVRSASTGRSSTISSFSQSNSSHVAGFFLQAGHVAHLEEDVQRLARQVLANVGIMRLHDPFHRLAIGEADVVEEAGAQESARQFLFVV